MTKKPLTTSEQRERAALLCALSEIRVPIAYAATSGGLFRRIKEGLRETLSSVLGIHYGMSISNIYRDSSADTLNVVVDFYIPSTHTDLLETEFVFNITGEEKEIELQTIKIPQVLATQRDSMIMEMLQQQIIALADETIHPMEIISEDSSKELRQFIKKYLRHQESLAQIPYHLDFFKPIIKNISQQRQSHTFVVPVTYRKILVTTFEATIVVENTSQQTTIRKMEMRVLDQ